MTGSLKPNALQTLFTVPLAEWLLIDQHAAAILSGDFQPRSPQVRTAAEAWRPTTVPALAQLSSQVDLYGTQTAPSALRKAAAALSAPGVQEAAAVAAIGQLARDLLAPANSICDAMAKVVDQIDLLLTADDADDQDTQFTFLGPDGKRLRRVTGEVTGRWAAIRAYLGEIQADATDFAKDEGAFLATLDVESTAEEWVNLGTQARGFGSDIARIDDYAKGARPVCTLVQYRNRRFGLAYSIPRGDVRTQEALWKDGMRAVSIDAFSMNGEVFFNFVLRGQRHPKSSSIEIDLDDAQLQARVQALKSGSHKVHALTSYLVGGQRRHGLLVHKVELRDPMNNPTLEFPELFATDAAVQIGRTLSEHQADLLRYQGRGYMVMSQSFLQGPAGIEVTALYHLYDDDSISGMSSQAWSGLPMADLSAKITGYNGPPRQLTALVDQGHRNFGAVMFPAFFTEEHRLTVDLSPGAQLRRAYDLDRQWFYPVCTTGYVDGGLLRYATSWGKDLEVDA